MEEGGSESLCFLSVLSARPFRRRHVQTPPFARALSLSLSLSCSPISSTHPHSGNLASDNVFHASFPNIYIFFLSQHSRSRQDASAIARRTRKGQWSQRYLFPHPPFLFLLSPWTSSSARLGSKMIDVLVPFVWFVIARGLLWYPQQQQQKSVQEHCGCPRKDVEERRDQGHAKGFGNSCSSSCFFFAIERERFCSFPYYPPSLLYGDGKIDDH